MNVFLNAFPIVHLGLLDLRDEPCIMQSYFPGPGFKLYCLFKVDSDRIILFRSDVLFDLSISGMLFLLILYYAGL